MTKPKHSRPPSDRNLKQRIRGRQNGAVGDLTGRPDLVIEGEAQDTGLPPEDQVPSRS